MELGLRSGECTGRDEIYMDMNTTRSMSGANMMVYIHDVEAQKRKIETGLTI